ncbi:MULTISPECIES: serine O-acetyltransferase [unclassified Adlercreutzia]|uniref:serine O-acetyltransferase n=1 Tax=unclassified Adlercreutzia TaxID=2636013 RepID=UPI0013ED86E6|nr:MULTISPECIES: serine O-acetyltransferase [unclassified Adlercreutzia]
MFGDNLDRIVTAIEKNYEADEIFFTKPGLRFPSRTAVKEILKGLRRVVFPGYFGEEMLSPNTSPTYFIGEILIQIERKLREQIIIALTYTDDSCGNTIDIGHCGECAPCHIIDRAAEVCTTFFDELPRVQQVLLTDVEALYEGDPAAGSKEEVIFSYPGLYAIYVYRLAHILYEMDVPIIPRIMTELAHSGTGIDIGAGAKIGEYFFIDHGTGVVIGETTEIGDHVKLYQGVTLGALSTRGGQRLSGVKRHPTIEDNVTIYSNASVLGGETVIGEGSVIAGSTFVTFSVPPHSRVSVKEQEITVRQPGEKD